MRTDVVGADMARPLFGANPFSEPNVVIINLVQL